MSDIFLQTTWNFNQPKMVEGRDPGIYKAPSHTHTILLCIPKDAQALPSVSKGKHF